METNYEILTNGRLFFDECDLCSLPGQLFRSCDSHQNVCINCILSRCNYEDDGTPCMNCVNYGFFNDEQSNYPGNGEGRCNNCYTLPALDFRPTIENYRTILRQLRRQNRVTKLKVEETEFQR